MLKSSSIPIYNKLIFNDVIIIGILGVKSSLLTMYADVFATFGLAIELFLFLLMKICWRPSKVEGRQDTKSSRDKLSLENDYDAFGFEKLLSVFGESSQP